MFFFQAEDGIRDIGVTGVQTCALPISARSEKENLRNLVDWTITKHYPEIGGEGERRILDWFGVVVQRTTKMVTEWLDRKSVVSGKSVDLGGRRIIKKKTIARMPALVPL